MEFKEILNRKIDYIEDLLNEYMPKEEGYQQTIMKAMNYSLKAGGKRLRPILTLESCKIVGGNEEDAIPFAMAIEMIHTYSLIHDDLPALDNDDLRKENPLTLNTLLATMWENAILHNKTSWLWHNPISTLLNMNNLPPPNIPTLSSPTRCALWQKKLWATRMCTR